MQYSILSLGLAALAHGHSIMQVSYEKQLTKLLFKSSSFNGQTQ